MLVFIPDGKFSNYNTFVAAPAARIAAKKTATSNLSAIIVDGNSELETLDKLVGNFQTANPDFVSTFKNSRNIVDSGATQTKVKGKVTDAVSGLPLAGAEIFDLDSGTSTFSDTQGKYELRVSEGQHNFRCHLDSYADNNVNNVQIQHGQSNVLNFVMIH